MVAALVAPALVTAAMTAAAGMAATFMAATRVSRGDGVTTAAVGKSGMAPRIAAAPWPGVTAMEAMPAVATAPAIASAPSISAPVIARPVPAALVPAIVTAPEREKLSKDEIEPQARERRRRLLGDRRLSHGAAGEKG